MSVFMPDVLTESAIDTLEQLFINGPTWDGNVVSKAGRDELVRHGLAFRENGWQSLTAEGIRLASGWNIDDLRGRSSTRWYAKAYRFQ